MIESVKFIQEIISQSAKNTPLFSDDMEAQILNIAEIDNINNSESLIYDIRNGETALALERLIPANIRRKSGIFFTGAQLADNVASRLAPILQNGVQLTDPTCGGGNLLVACAKYLPLGSDLSETLKIWSSLLHGYDLHHQFVWMAQLRLTLLAASLQGEDIKSVAPLQPAEIFSGIKVGDLFSTTSFTEQAQCVVMNPPFGYVQTPDNCHWSTGRVQVAGLFFERLVRYAPKGQHIVGILPDVLRSGTRYGKWREFVSSHVSSLEIEIAGRFDAKTDVDVFILHIIAGAPDDGSIEWPTLQPTSSANTKVISDYFDVHVGPVVPHRHPHEGLRYPYIHARAAKAWQILNHVEDRRQFRGTVFSPPFVVVHRTSSPSDGNRCVGTVINGNRDVAVENHLLVLLPRDKSLGSCIKLLDVLKSVKSNDWLNQRIRCRHLTVSALSNMPCSLGDETK